MKLEQYCRLRAAHRWLVIGSMLILSHPAYSSPAIPASCEGVKEGLIACYPFDGNTNDLSGKNYHGVPKNITYAEGQAGQAARFDGKTSYVEIANNPDLNSPQISFSAWVKPTINVNKQGNPVGHGMIFNKELQYELAIFEEDSPSKPIKGGEFSFAFGNNWDWMPAPGAFVPPNKFVHLVLTFTKERTAKLYVEGKLIGEQKYANPLGANALCVRIGARNCPSPNPSLSFRDMFEGDIDEFRIYNRELSETEVKQLAGVADPVVPPAPPAPVPSTASLCNIVPDNIVACYPFNGNTDDYSGNNNHAKILRDDPNTAVTLTEGRHNIPNSAYKFSGNSHNKIIQILREATFSSTNAMTISTWFKTTAHANFDGIINLHSHIDQLNCCQYRMMLDPNLHPFYDAGEHADQTINNFTFKPDTWYHYTMAVRGGDAAEIYVNGELVAKSNAGVPQTLPNGKFLFIGSDGFIEQGRRDLHSFEGIVDDVLIYKKALSADEVKRLYHAPSDQKVEGNTASKPVEPQPPASFDVVVTKTGTGDVKTSDSSIDCGATCQHSYTVNSGVNLTATPAAGYLFKEWSGDCAGNTPVVALTVDKAKTCTATFIQQPPPPPTLPSQSCFGVTGAHGQDRAGYCNDYAFEGNNVPCLIFKSGELAAGECAQAQLAPKPLANNVLPYAKQAFVGKNFSATMPRCDGSVEFGTEKTAAPSSIAFVCVRYQKAVGNNSFYYGVALVNNSQILSYKFETSPDTCIGNCAK